MQKYIKLQEITKIATGLNIEGYRPTLTLPNNCKWYNIIQIIDEQLKGINFDTIMQIVKDNKYEYIEQAIGINMDNFINQISELVKIISKNHKNPLVHIHQYTGTTILDKTINKNTGIQTILDTTNFFETPIDYKKEYPNIDALISISQCAGFGHEAGTWIIPTGFMEFDVKKNIIYTDKIYAQNYVKNIIDCEKLNNNLGNFKYIEGDILVVNDLWNPNFEENNQVLLISEKSDNFINH